MGSEVSFALRPLDFEKHPLVSLNWEVEGTLDFVSMLRKRDSCLAAVGNRALNSEAYLLDVMKTFFHVLLSLLFAVMLPLNVM